MPLSLLSVMPGGSPVAALTNLPRFASSCCPRPPTLWQRWWARHEGVWLHDRWYCSLDCFQEGVFHYLQVAAIAPPRSDIRPNRLPLGLVLLSTGEITAEQLRTALDLQRTAGTGKLGEWLIRMGVVSEQQVTAALAAQQGCPLFRMQELATVPARMHWPEPLIHRYRALPLYHNPAPAALYVGFLEGADRTFLHLLEKMLRCRVQPCIAPPRTYQQCLELHSMGTEAESIVIQQRQNLIEMTRTVGYYAQQIRAERCSIGRWDVDLWVRLEPARGPHLDFLFRLPTTS